MKYRTPLVTERIFKTAERAFKGLFLKHGASSYRVRKQNIFPCGATIKWNRDEREGYWFSTWALPAFHTIAINFHPERLESMENIEEVYIKPSLVHELTHIMQHGGKKGYMAPSSNRAYEKSYNHEGIFGKFHFTTLLAFITPNEVEAMIYESMHLQWSKNKKGGPMKALEETIRFSFQNWEGYEDGIAFARENAIVNIIPNHPRLLDLFSKDPAYTMPFHGLKHKARALERASRLFIHLQNLVNDLDEKALKRAIERFKNAYAKHHDPSVFEKLIKGRRKKQRVCHTRARA